MWPELPRNSAAGLPRRASQGNQVDALFSFAEASLVSHIVSLRPESPAPPMDPPLRDRTVTVTAGRACGMGGLVVAIFGKYHLPQGVDVETYS